MTKEKFSIVFKTMLNSKCIEIKDITMMDTWYKLLSHYPDTDIEKAAMMIIYNQDIIRPTVADMIAILENKDDYVSVATQCFANLQYYLEHDEAVKTPIMREFVNSYGGQRELKTVLNEIKQIPYIRKEFIEFTVIRLKEKDKAERAEKINKMLAPSTEAKKIEEKI